MEDFDENEEGSALCYVLVIISQHISNNNIDGNFICGFLWF